MGMFCRENFDFLCTVIDIYTKNEDDSVKAQAEPLLSVKKSATVMQYSLFAKKLDKEADEMCKFNYTLKCFQEFFLDVLLTK